MEVSDAINDAVKDSGNIFLFYFFVFCHVIPQIFIGTVLANHMYFFQFLVYIQVIAFDDILVGETFLDAVMLFYMSNVLQFNGFEYFGCVYISCVEFFAFIYTRMAPFSYFLLKLV
jgi:hypothetical protein